MMRTIKEYWYLVALALALVAYGIYDLFSPGGSNDSASGLSLACIGRVNAYASIVASAAASQGVPASRLSAHMAVESGGTLNAVGTNGEMGLMQIKPSTLLFVNNYYQPTNPWSEVDMSDARNNIFCAAMYLSYLNSKLGNMRLASIAYNVGENGDKNSFKAKNYWQKISTAERAFS